MSNSNDSIPAKTKPPWLIRSWSHLWFRLSCLIGLLVFELGFMWFILHFGWMESVNLWTQLGVVLVAALPLLVAAFFLIRKRFSLTSAMIAFTMFAVFMGFTMRPVYDARQARLPAKLLSDCGARFGSKISSFDMDSEVPRSEYHVAEKIPLSEWKVRLIGDCADHPADKEILYAVIESEEQLAVLAGVVGQLTNLQRLQLSVQLEEGYAVQEKLIRDSGADQLVLGNYFNKIKLRTDLNWLANCEAVQTLFMLNVSNDFEMILKSDALKLGGIVLQNSRPGRKIPLVDFVEAKAVRDLKMLSLNGYQISDADARLFSKLHSLRNLSISDDRLDAITFLHHLPQVKIVRVGAPLLTAKQLEDFVIPENLQEIHLIVSSLLISESEADKFKASAPEGCTVHVTR